MKFNNLFFLKKIVTPVALILTSLFILRTILIYWNQVADSLSSLSWIALAFAGLFYLGYFYFRAVSWHFIIEALGQKQQLLDNFSSWFLGEATRYIPGNIWSFVSRVYLAKQKGIAKSVTAI